MPACPAPPGPRRRNPANSRSGRVRARSPRTRCRRPVRRIPLRRARGIPSQAASCRNLRCHRPVSAGRPGVLRAGFRRGPRFRWPPWGGRAQRWGGSRVASPTTQSPTVRICRSSRQAWINLGQGAGRERFVRAIREIVPGRAGRCKLTAHRTEHGRRTDCCSLRFDPDALCSRRPLLSPALRFPELRGNGSVARHGQVCRLATRCYGQAR